MQRCSQTQEREQTRERRCEHGREKRTESLPCAKKTQPVTECRSKNVQERPMEKNVPEQGPRQFPTQAANDGWLRGWFPTFMSELPSSVSSTLLYQMPLQSGPWVIKMEVDTLTLLSSRFNMSFCTKRVERSLQPSELRSPFQPLGVGRAALNTPSRKRWSKIL